MNVSARQMILRANSVFLLAASTGGFISDLAGAFFGLGPVGRVVESTPDAVIGFVEAHGLAFIFGVLLWRAEATRTWHVTAGAIHVLLGTSNLVFWQLFVAMDMMAMGYITTGLHIVFAALQMVAARQTRERASRFA